MNTDKRLLLNTYLGCECPVCKKPFSTHADVGEAIWVTSRYSPPIMHEECYNGLPKQERDRIVSS